MNKEELKQLIKEEILKEFAYARLTNQEEYKAYQEAILDVIDDLTRRKTTKSEAIYRIKQLFAKFASWSASWGESEAFDEIAFINQQYEEHKEEEAKKSQ